MSESHKIKIPDKLKNKGLGFAKVIGKRAYEFGWQNNPHTEFEIEAHLAKTLENYGVICGINNLIIIDIDDIELAEKLKNEFPSTFMVKTSKGYHFYYFCTDVKKKILLKKDFIHYGEILSNGFQAVGPYSVHPETKKPYLPMNDTEIANITYAEIFFILSEYIEIREPSSNKFEQDSEIKIESVIEAYGLNLDRKGNEYFGSNPIHGSTNGKNFWINTDKNAWHCFRCDSGGGSILLVAVLEGIITCEEAKKKSLTGEKFIRTAKIIKEKFNIDILRSNSSLTGMEKINAIISNVESISKVISKLELATSLDPILKELAKIDETQADAILSENIKKHFNLTNKKIELFERKLKDLRKRKKQERQEQPNLSHSAILELLEKEKDIVQIHPAIDYKNSTVYFGVLIRDELYTVTSNREIIQAKNGDKNE